MFLRGLNLKLYQNEIVIKPKVNNVILLCDRSKNSITLSIKEIIPRMVTHTHILTPLDFLLDPDSRSFDPPYFIYYGKENLRI